MSPQLGPRLWKRRSSRQTKLAPLASAANALPRRDTPAATLPVRGSSKEQGFRMQTRASTVVGRSYSKESSAAPASPRLVRGLSRGFSNGSAYAQESSAAPASPRLVRGLRRGFSKGSASAQESISPPASPRLVRGLSRCFSKGSASAQTDRTRMGSHLAALADVGSADVDVLHEAEGDAQGRGAWRSTEDLDDEFEKIYDTSFLESTARDLPAKDCLAPILSAEQQKRHNGRYAESIMDALQRAETRFLEVEDEEMVPLSSKAGDMDIRDATVINRVKGKLRRAIYISEAMAELHGQVCPETPSGLFQTW